MKRKEIQFHKMPVCWADLGTSETARALTTTGKRLRLRHTDFSSCPLGIWSIFRENPIFREIVYPRDVHGQGYSSSPGPGGNPPRALSVRFSVRGAEIRNSNLQMGSWLLWLKQLLLTKPTDAWQRSGSCHSVCLNQWRGSESTCGIPTPTLDQASSCLLSSPHSHPRSAFLKVCLHHMRMRVWCGVLSGAPGSFFS